MAIHAMLALKSKPGFNALNKTCDCLSPHCYWPPVNGHPMIGLMMPLRFNGVRNHRVRGPLMLGSTRMASVPVSAANLDSEPLGPMRARHLVFVDEASRALLRLLERISPSDASVHIAGETGTGKELVARQIHQMSGRSGPFAAVNCGAINEHLAESELFGHEAGSFTGANARREGWFEAANGGTLFLDEIGDLSLQLQGKLLRVLQEGEVSRVGSRRSTPINVRIISATNADLAAAVAAGKFRQDLFYRLHIVPVRLLPLRERLDDIDALVEHFILVYSRRLKRQVPHLQRGALEALRRYSWPGNIRELENVIHVSLLMNADSEIRPEHWRLPSDESASKVSGNATIAPVQQSLDRIGEALRACFAKPNSHLLRDIERRVVVDAYRYCESNQVRTAELLGVSRNVIRTLLKRHGLLNEVAADGGLDEDDSPDRANQYFSSGRLPTFARTHVQPRIDECL
jgi:DNA-binding NtrC family response regulator